MLDKEIKGERYIQYLKELIRKDFCGDVTVHFFEGGIRSITKEGDIAIPLRIKETVKLK